MNNRILIAIVCVLVVIILVLTGILIWNPFQKSTTIPEENNVACTQEAKLCPDGSYASRTGSNCEFAICPNLTTVPEWETFKDDNLGIEFRYPGEWLQLTPMSQEDDAYVFESSNKIITEVQYYEPTNILAFITKGTVYQKQRDIDPIQYEICEYILKIIYPNGVTKSIYTENSKSLVDNLLPEYSAFGGNKLSYIALYPNEKYIGVSWSAYEAGGSYLFNIESGVNILKPYPILSGKAYWSPDNKTLLFDSYYSDFSGEGTDGLFVSDYGNPDKLNLIFSFNVAEHAGSSEINNMKFVNNDKISFTAIYKTYDLESYSLVSERMANYEYNIKTKELKEIK